MLTCAKGSMKNRCGAAVDTCLLSARCMFSAIAGSAASSAAESVTTLPGPVAATNTVAAVGSWGPAAAVVFGAREAWAFCRLLVDDLRTHGHPHHRRGHGHGEAGGYDELHTGTLFSKGLDAVLLAANTVSVVLLVLVLIKEVVRPVRDVLKQEKKGGGRGERKGGMTKGVARWGGVRKMKVE